MQEEICLSHSDPTLSVISRLFGGKQPVSRFAFSAHDEAPAGLHA
jgi:hypothetical protein